MLALWRTTLSVHLQDGVDHDHPRSRLATRGSRWRQLITRRDDICRVTNLDVGAHDPQAQRTHKRRDNGGVATSPDIDECAVEDDRGDGLDKPVDARVQRDVGDAEGAE